MGTTEDPGYWGSSPSVLQSTLILIDPALMAASISISRSWHVSLTLTEGESYTPGKRRLPTMIFVTGDVLAVSFQPQNLFGLYF